MLAHKLSTTTIKSLVIIAVFLWLNIGNKPLAIADDTKQLLAKKIIGNVTSDEIMNIKSTHTIEDIKKIYNNTRCTTVDDNKIWCILLEQTDNNPIGIEAEIQYNVSISYDEDNDTAKYDTTMLDDVKAQPVITNIIFDFKLSYDFVSELDFIDQIKNVLDGYGFRMKSSGMLKATAMELAESPLNNNFSLKDTSMYLLANNQIREYISTNHLNYADCSLMTPYLTKKGRPGNGLWGSGIRLSYNYGIPNAVKRIDSINEITTGKYITNVSVSSLKSDVNKFPNTINIKIYDKDLNIYTDTITTEPDCTISLLKDNARYIRLDDTHNALCIKYSCGSGNRANTQILALYNYDETSDKFSKFTLSDNFIEAKQIKNDGINYIISEYLTSYTGAPWADVTTLPIIYKYTDGSFKNVTKQHPDYLNMLANKCIEDYKKSNSTGTLYRYLLLKHMAGSSKEAWKQFDTIYKGRDKAKLKKLLKNDVNSEINKIYSIKEATYVK